MIMTGDLDTPGERLALGAVQGACRIQKRTFLLLPSEWTLLCQKGSFGTAAKSLGAMETGQRKWPLPASQFTTGSTPGSPRPTISAQ